MPETPNLGLPELQASQAQKHVTLNEALRMLDGLVQLSVKDRDLAAPPGSAGDGDRYLVGAGANGDWTGWQGSIAIASDGIWTRLIPKSGWRVWVEDEKLLLIWDGAAWIDAIPSEFQNLGSLGVNASADTTNRLTVASDAVLLTHAGSGMQMKLNKNAASDTASLLYQCGWSGRAEIGFAGDDNLRVKVSPDGGTFHDAMVVDRTSGGVSFPNGAEPERHLPESVAMLGGSDWWGPADPMTLAYNHASSIALAADRMMFAAFYVPRPLLLLGAFVCINTASTTAGALLRVGIYRLGGPSGNNWNVGERMADFGTDLADNAGNKYFDLASPQAVEPGWYLTAMGVSGTGAKAIYGRWLTPGTQRLYGYSSGTNARPRVAGHSFYLYENSCNAEITGGLPATWTKNPVTDQSSTNGWVQQCVYPKWRLP